MPWYEPSATPPTASIYYEGRDNNVEVESNEVVDEYEFEFEGKNNGDECVSVSASASASAREVNRDDRSNCINYLNDPLVRRMSALLSPILPSCVSSATGSTLQLPVHVSSLMKKDSPGSTSTKPQSRSIPFHSPFPHPSFRHRESPIPQRVFNYAGADRLDERALFFYPRSLALRYKDDEDTSGNCSQADRRESSARLDDAASRRRIDISRHDRRNDDDGGGDDRVQVSSTQSGDARLSDDILSTQSTTYACYHRNQNHNHNQNRSQSQNQNRSQNQNQSQSQSQNQNRSRGIFENDGLSPDYQTAKATATEPNNYAISNSMHLHSADAMATQYP